MNETEVIEVQPQELLVGLAEVIRETQRKVGYYEVKSIGEKYIDDAIKETLSREKRILTEAEIQALAAKLYTKILIKTTNRGLSLLSEYYAQASRMSMKELMSEKHKPSKLSRHMRYVGTNRPSNVAAHAIVSGNHSEAIAARRILARWKIRIDDPDNGVFLPRDSRFIPHNELPNAVNHAKLHSNEYYLNVTNMLGRSTSQNECRSALRLIALELQNGDFKF